MLRGNVQLLQLWRVHTGIKKWNTESAAWEKERSQDMNEKLAAAGEPMGEQAVPVLSAGGAGAGSSFNYGSRVEPFADGNMPKIPP